MLFNSYVFIIVFLPIVLLGFHLIGQKGHHRVVIGWLVSTSLFFYGWWNPAYLGLVVVSIVFNYAIGHSLGKRQSVIILTFGIVVNLFFLGYFKYANFFIDNFNILFHRSVHLDQVVLPLAISFFTFQQITYLVDANRQLTKEYNFFHYCLFVTFFPQLIAGPIVHQKEMLPQFINKKIYKLKASHLSVGITIFVLGLFKKVVFADNIAMYANPVFEAAENEVILTFFEAWVGALAYSFQLYFDFSGYSDMAIGLARMFGVHLPINFYSPYKANSIIEFWRRWHITLARFLRDYLYIPLGGNRKGNTRRYIALIITMLLGGLWHGAGWTFIIWGGMHGIFLSINHAWNSMVRKVFPRNNDESSIITKIACRLVTFVAVVIAWVMFRADSVESAMAIYSGMFGCNGISLPVLLESRLGEFGETLKMFGINYAGMFQNLFFGDGKIGIIQLFVMLIIISFSPNTYDLLGNDNPTLDLYLPITKKIYPLRWKYNPAFAVLLTLLTIGCLFGMCAPSDFLYFQF